MIKFITSRFSSRKRLAKREKSVFEYLFEMHVQNQIEQKRIADYMTIINTSVLDLLERDLLEHK